MKTRTQLITLFTLLLFGFPASAQDSLNIVQLGHLPYTDVISEVRGAQHNGREYAFVGVVNGLSIVDVQDPTNPTEVFFEPGPQSIWRDPFYHNGHLYCVQEANGNGLLIVNMNPLPGSNLLTTTLYTGSLFSFSSAHNLFVDTANDKLYIFDSNSIDGAIILDISDPMNPVELGVWNDFTIHDGFVRGDTLWAACLGAGAFVVDVSLPSNPVVLANWNTPNMFTHNIWPSDNNAFSFTTDEVSSGFIAAYDMSDLDNVVETDKVQHPLSDGVLPHNTHFFNDYLVSSHYKDGVTIHDVSDPSNIILTGYFDTSPLTGGGSDGNWGAWPYLASGNLLVSDIQEGLFVFGPTYKRAARIEGTVTELGTGNLLNDVQVEILTTGNEQNTNLFGNYATGLEQAGSYNVQFLKGGYLPQIANNVTLLSGQTTVVDMQLVPDISFVMQGIVTDASTGNPIANAQVRLENNLFDILLTTNAQGVYSDTAFFGGQYNITVAIWGHIGQCISVTPSVQNPNLPNVVLQPGYYDDFSHNLGWTIEGDATTGIWVRDLPIGTEFNGTPANPSSDSNGDCGGFAFVTGNLAGAVNIEDVDAGMTTLLSPSMNLTATDQAVLQFDYWFFNQGGNSRPNDQLLVKIDNGTDLITIASLPVTNNMWTNYSIAIQDFVTLTDNMKLRLEIEDAAPGHLVEGGIDRFSMSNVSTGLTETETALLVSIFPNPNNSNFVYVVIKQEFREATVQLRDVMGKIISDAVKLTSKQSKISIPKEAGIYLIETEVDGNRNTQRLVIQ